MGVPTCVPTPVSMSTMESAMMVGPGRSPRFAPVARTARTAVRVPRMIVAPPVAGAAAEEVRAARVLEGGRQVTLQEFPPVEAHQAAVLPLHRVGASPAVQS